MRKPARPSHEPSGTRRYLVHLSRVRNEATENGRYLIRIQPWKPRSSAGAQAHERFLEDECALVETVNPLLPRGSDIRNVLSHIESAEGFLYLLHLNPEQARLLGWRG